jgi:hypothetical protein
MATRVKKGSAKVSVKHQDMGAVVVRGRDWSWLEQDAGALYGVIHDTGAPPRDWVSVTWYDMCHNVIDNYHMYRVGHGDYYDLYYYDADDIYGVNVIGKEMTVITDESSDDLPGNMYPEDFVKWIIRESLERQVKGLNQNFAEVYTVEVLYQIYQDELKSLES